jgi:hypothetical protein
MAKEDVSKDQDKLRRLTEQLELFSNSAKGLPHVPSRRTKRGWDDDLAGHPRPKKSNTAGDSLEIDGYECMKTLRASSSNRVSDNVDFY